MGASADAIYHDVDGAPFQIGDRVKVVALADDTADPMFLGRTGRVVCFGYTCGCGQTFPHDPMIGVKFRQKVEDFWREELAIVHNKAGRYSKGQITRLPRLSKRAHPAG